MLYQSFQRYWLILPVLLTILGSAFKVAAKERVDISIPELERVESYTLASGEMQLLKSASLTILKDVTASQYPLENSSNQSLTKEEIALLAYDIHEVIGRSPVVTRRDSSPRHKQTVDSPVVASLRASPEGRGLSDTQKHQNFRPNGEQQEIVSFSPSRDFTVAQVPRVITPIEPQPLIPRVITPRERQQPIPTLPPSDEQPPTLQTPPTPTTPSNRPEIPGSITVERFEFVGNTVFSNEELAEVTKPFTGRAITFAELLQAEAAVAKKYTDTGYINSGAVIPTDQILAPTAAVVKIQIIEGGVEDIRVTGTRRLNRNYIRSRLAIATKKPLNRDRLLEALQLLQLDPLIQSLSAQLSTGTRPESSLLEVSVQEADSFYTEFFADNGRVPSVGSFRRGIRINEGNLFGFGDSVGFVYTNTDGSNAFDIIYTVPLNPRNGTISLAAGLSDTEVIEPPFDRFDIIGDSRYYELSFRQPISQTPTKEFTLGLTASREESETELLGTEFPLSPGANDDGETRISALRFFQEYTQRSPQEVFAARSQFSLGIGAFDATINSEPPDSRFFSWRGQAQYVRLLAPETLFIFRSDAQLTTRALVPLEQIGLGGLRSVRGYRQDTLLTDNGIFASAELRLPILRVSSVRGVLQLTPFVDFGVGWNSSDIPDPEDNSLLGVGLGLLWQMGNNFTARFDYGIPLIDVDTGDRTLQENGLYFSVNYSPF